VTDELFPSPLTLMQALGPRPTVEFTVYGVPVPKGSHTPFKDARGNARMKDTAGARLQAWAREVAAEARTAAAEHGPFRDPVALSAMFRFEMPKSRPKADRERGWCWRPITPDLDKLVRAIGDACKVGGLLTDDAIICELRTIRKVEVREQWTGATIRVAPLLAAGGARG
jgi:Holliday junction resolvase RusA-like endonuclease